MDLLHIFLIGLAAGFVAGLIGLLPMLFIK
jgi:hypothetical protein